MKTTELSRQTNFEARGFALLLSIVVISVVLAVGLSLLNITLKQYTLSATSRDSEIAFGVASTAMDCARYAVSDSDVDAAFLSASGPSIWCGVDSGAQTPNDSTAISTNGETLYKHTYTFNIVTSPSELCADISVYKANPTTNDISYALTNEGLTTFECAAGYTCTTIFARGYNRPCNDLSSIRTVQRELTVQY